MDLISRQAAIDALDCNFTITGKENAETVYQIVKGFCDKIKTLPSVEPTLYGYKIEHLAFIARVMGKENVPPEKVIEILTDIGRVVEMVLAEQKEIIRKAVEECRI